MPRYNSTPSLQPMISKEVPELSLKELRFVEEFLKDPENIRGCLLRAGFSRNQTEALENTILSRPHIENWLEVRRNQIAALRSITPESLAAEWARLAFFDIGEVVDFENNVLTVRDFSSIPPELRRVIKAIEVDRYGQVKVTFYDKLSALDKLSKIFQLYTEGPLSDDGTKSDEKPVQVEFVRKDQLVDMTEEIGKKVEAMQLEKDEQEAANKAAMKKAGIEVSEI